MDYDNLDDIAAEALAKNDQRIGGLTTCERIYVAFASSRMDLIPDFSIPQAINRLGLLETEMLVHRWRYR